MPGFRFDGSREAAAWQGDDIAPETAQHWLSMQQDGYFLESASSDGGSADSSNNDGALITGIELEPEHCGSTPACAEQRQDAGYPVAGHCEQCARLNDEWVCLEKGRPKP